MQERIIVQFYLQEIYSFDSSSPNKIIDLLFQLPELHLHLFVELQSSSESRLNVKECSDLQIWHSGECGSVSR